MVTRSLKVKPCCRGGRKLAPCQVVRALRQEIDGLKSRLDNAQDTLLLADSFAKIREKKAANEIARLKELVADRDRVCHINTMLMDDLHALAVFACPSGPIDLDAFDKGDYRWCDIGGVVVSRKRGWFTRLFDRLAESVD